MRRKIIFRAKEINTNNWVFGYITDTSLFISIDTEIRKTRIDENTICQYICDDIDGNMIFEKDIVVNINDRKKETYRLYYDDWYKSFRKSASTVAGSSYVPNDNYKVVGNMIDCPEILKEPEQSNSEVSKTAIYESSRRRSDRYFLGQFK